MTAPPWHITHSACMRYAFAMRWPKNLDKDTVVTRATDALTLMMPHAGYRERDRYGREQWKSPGRTGGALRWVIDPRIDRTRAELPQVIWVGHGVPPQSVWAP